MPSLGEVVFAPPLFFSPVEGYAMKRPLVYFIFALFFYMFSILATAHAAVLKPFILGNTPAGGMAAVVSLVESALAAHNFTLVSSAWLAQITVAPR